MSTTEVLVYTLSDTMESAVLAMRVIGTTEVLVCILNDTIKLMILAMGE